MTTVPWSVQRLGPYLSQGLGIPAERLREAFRPATAEDIPRILELRRAVNGDATWWDDEAFVRWRYFEEQDGAQPRYWVFEQDGEAMGGMGLEPVELVVDGEPYHATRTLDIMVRPDLQGRGLGALMNLLLFERYPITLVAGSNARSHKLISRMFQQALDLRVWKMLVRSGDYVGRHLSPGPLAGAVAASADLVLGLERTVRRRRLPEELELQELSRFDERVTRLSLEQERHGGIMVRRSAEYLNWRFVRNPRCPYRIIGGFIGGRLVGYVVMRLNLARPNPRREGEIVDWLAGPALERGTSPLSFLMQAAVDQLVKDGARLIRCLAFGATVKPVMATSGLRLREDERLPFFVRAMPASLHERLSDGRGWFLTSCDFDVE